MLTLIAGGLVLACVAFHLLVLQTLSRLELRIAKLSYSRVGFLLLGTIVGHLIEIAFFAVVYWLLLPSEWAGAIDGIEVREFDDYYYFSAVTFTTTGYGDLVPLGSVRTLVAVEALTGMILLAWTASFIFLLMQRRMHELAPERTRHAQAAKRRGSSKRP